MRKVWTLLALTALGAGPAFAAGPVAVEVTERGGVYTVNGQFEVAAAPAGAWRVITDYDGLGAVVPDMRSRVIARSGPHAARVAQETTTRLWAFSATHRVVLEVAEEPHHRVRFTDVEKRDFLAYEGAWKLEPAGARTRVRYEARVQPRFMPPAVGEAVMASTVRQLLTRLRDEVERRSGER